METAAIWIGLMIAFALGLLFENRLHARLIRRDIREREVYKEGLNVIADYAAHDVKLTQELYKNVPPEHFREPAIFNIHNVPLRTPADKIQRIRADLAELEQAMVTSDITNGEIFLANELLAMDVVDTAALGGWICKRATAMSVDLICMLIPEFNGQRIVWYPGNINEGIDIDVSNN